MPTIDELRTEIQHTLERYYQLESQLQQLEKDRFRVCIFGSARIRPEDPVYRMVYELARMLSQLNIDIVTGGGPGLMEAANRGVQDGENHSRSIGLTILLPRSQELANRHLDIKSEHTRFSSRLDEFMRLSHAVVVAPGGIGTLLELLYVWQLIQVGMISPRPVVLVDRGLWTGLLNWTRRELLGRAFVSPGDFDCLHCVDTPQEVLPFVEAELEKFRLQQESRPEGAARAAEAARMLEAIENKRNPRPPVE